jgi:hypothetical protein
MKKRIELETLEIRAIVNTSLLVELVCTISGMIKAIVMIKIGVYILNIMDLPGLGGVFESSFESQRSLGFGCQVSFR